VEWRKGARGGSRWSEGLELPWLQAPPRRILSANRGAGGRRSRQTRARCLPFKEREAGDSSLEAPESADDTGSRKAAWKNGFVGVSVTMCDSRTGQTASQMSTLGSEVVNQLFY
jgi:hypothetical protein